MRIDGQDDRPRPRKVRKGRSKVRKVRSQTSVWIELDNLQLHLLVHILAYVRMHKLDHLHDVQVEALQELGFDLAEAATRFNWDYVPHSVLRLESDPFAQATVDCGDLLP